MTSAALEPSERRVVLFGLGNGGVKVIFVSGLILKLDILIFPHHIIESLDQSFFTLLSLPQVTLQHVYLLIHQLKFLLFVCLIVALDTPAIIPSFILIDSLTERNNHFLEIYDKLSDNLMDAVKFVIDFGQALKGRKTAGVRQLRYGRFPSRKMGVETLNILFQRLLQISLVSKVVIYIHNYDLQRQQTNLSLILYHFDSKSTFLTSFVLNWGCLLISQYITMESEQVDPQKLKKLQKLWKVFGRETKAGKEMFDLYNIAEKPKLDYPKTKPKSQKEIDAQKEKLAVTKKCPQKTAIDYPDLPRPERPVFHPVDFIPKRKTESVIRKEIQEYYEHRARNIPVNRGVDRANLVRKLQQKFKMQRGILPKSADLPALSLETKFDQELIKENAKIKVDKKGQNYTQPLKNEEKTEPKKELKNELEELFDQIVAEIDERQQYLESIEHLEEPKLKEKIKKQMIERVAELQKIAEMKK